MSRRKRTHNAKVGRTSPRHSRTRALVVVLVVLAVAGIAATAWLTSAQESTRVTTTSNGSPTASGTPTATASPQPQPATATTTPTPPSTTANVATALNAMKTANANDAAAVQPSAPSSAGQRAFIDPVTGQLRQPEHDELAAIAAAAAAAPARRLARTANAAQESFGPDGSVEAVVPEDLHTFTVATRGPDGRITIEHAQGAKDAARVMKANTAKQGSRTQAKEDRNDR